MVKIRALPALAALLLVVVACGGNGGTGPDDDDEGTFTITITGGMSATVTGQGAFHVGVESFGIQLGGDDALVTIIGSGGRPGPGTLVIGSDGTGEVTLAGIVENTGIGADAGTLTISSSSSNRLVGSAEFTGKTLDQRDISATLSFDVPCSILASCG